MITYTMNETGYKCLLTQAFYAGAYCDAMEPNSVETCAFDYFSERKIWRAECWSLVRIVEHHAMLKAGALCSEIWDN